MRIRPYIVYRGQAHRCGSQPLVSDSEAVALAPPCTHAVHGFHVSLLNTLMPIILPEAQRFVSKQLCVPSFGLFMFIHGSIRPGEQGIYTEGRIQVDLNNPQAER